MTKKLLNLKDFIFYKYIFRMYQLKYERFSKERVNYRLTDRLTYRSAFVWYIVSLFFYRAYSVHKF